MSAISLDYPNNLPLRRSSNVRWIVVLIAGLVLVASVISVAAAASVKTDSSISVVAIPVPIAQVVDAQTQPAVVATPSPNPIVIAAPVATPPSQQKVQLEFAMIRKILKWMGEEDFIATMRTGVTPSGHHLIDVMPWKYFGQMTDDELKAVWLYLQSLPHCRRESES